MRQRAFFYVLIFLALGALACLVVALVPGSTPDTPPVLLSQPPAADSAAPPSAGPGAQDTVIRVAPDTVQTVVGTLRRAPAYSRTLTVRRYWNGGSAAQEIEAHILDGSARLSIRGEGATDRERKHILIRGDEAWIWYDGSAGLWHGPAAAGDADAFQTLLTYEDILALPPEDIVDAGYTTLEGEDCVYVRYRSGLLGYENCCYISDKTGLLMGLESYDGDRLIYSMRSSAPVLEEPAEALFQLPASGGTG